MKSFKTLKEHIIRLMIDNGFEVSAEDKTAISKALKRSRKRPEHIEKSIKSRIANVRKEPIKTQKAFKISDFIDYISNNTPKERAIRQEASRLKQAVKDRRGNHVCFYHDKDINFFLLNLIAVNTHAGMLDFDEQEVSSIIGELRTMAMGMDIAFIRVINRLKQLHKDGNKVMKMAHYLEYLDRRNKPLTKPTPQIIKATNIKVRDIVYKFLQEDLELKQGLFEQSVQGE